VPGVVEPEGLKQKTKIIFFAGDRKGLPVIFNSISSRENSKNYLIEKN
jgi:hypothetical protein